MPADAVLGEVGKGHKVAFNVLNFGRFKLGAMSSGGVKVNIAEAYVRIERGEAWLIGAHIAEYAQGNRYNHAPNRTRKLLLHRDQISELLGLQAAKGLTIVPLRLYLRGGNAKLEIGIARGKKAHDKRRTIAERDMRRELERESKAAGRIKL